MTVPDYAMRLDFTAANDDQAERLAAAWADTCAAEYDTRYAGLVRLNDGAILARSQLPTHDPDVTTAVCEWCGRAIRQVDGAWWAVKGEERGYHSPYCDAADDSRHSPSPTGRYALLDRTPKEGDDHTG